MQNSKVPQKGSLMKKFMAVALTGIVGLGALGVGAPQQAQAGFMEDVVASTATIVTQGAGQALNGIVYDKVYGGGQRGSGEIVKETARGTSQQVLNNATQRATSSVQQQVNQSINKIFQR